MTEELPDDEWKDENAGADDSMEVVLENDGTDDSIFPSTSILSDPYPFASQKRHQHDHPSDIDDIDECNTEEGDLQMQQLVNISGDFTSPTKSTYETATSAVVAAISEPLERLNNSIEEQVNTSLDSTMSCCQWLCQDLGQQVVEDQQPALISPDSAAQGTPVRDLWEEGQQRQNQDRSTTSWYLKPAPSSDTIITRPVDNRSPHRRLFGRNTASAQADNNLNVTASLMVSDSESEGEEEKPTKMESLEETGEEEVAVLVEEAKIDTGDDYFLPELVREAQGSPEKMQKEPFLVATDDGKLMDPIFEVTEKTANDAPNVVSFESSSLGEEDDPGTNVDVSYDGVYYGEDEDDLQSGTGDSYNGVFYGEEDDDLAVEPQPAANSSTESQARTETFENSLFVSADTTPEEFEAMESRLNAMHNDSKSSVTKGEFTEESLVLSRTVDSTSMLDPFGIQYVDQMNSTLQSVEEEDEEEEASSDESQGVEKMIDENDDDENSPSIDDSDLLMVKQVGSDVHTEAATASETASYEPFSCDQSPLKCDASSEGDLEADSVEEGGTTEIFRPKEEITTELDSAVDTQAAMDMLLQETNNYIQENDIQYNEVAPERTHPVGNTVPSYESTPPPSAEPLLETPPRILNTTSSDVVIVTPPLAEAVERNASFESAQEGFEETAEKSPFDKTEEEEQFFMTPNKLTAKRLSFADDHGQPLEEVKQLKPEPATSGRLVVLLLDPSERTFEFILLEYPIDEATTAKVLVEQLPTLATNDLFQYTQYVGISRIKGNKADDDEGEKSKSLTSTTTASTATPAPTILDANTQLGDAGFRNCELVLAVPSGSTSEEMITHAFPLLLNGTITKALQSGRRSARGLKHIKSGKEWGKSSAVKKKGLGEVTEDFEIRSREWNIVSDISETVVVFEKDMGDYAETPDELWQLADNEDDVFLHWVENEEEKAKSDTDGNHWDDAEQSKPVLFPQPPPDQSIWTYLGGKDGAERLIFALYFAAIAGVTKLIMMEHEEFKI